MTEYKYLLWQSLKNMAMLTFIFMLLFLFPKKNSY